MRIGSCSQALGPPLVLQSITGRPILSLTCPTAKNRLQINVPAFTPIGSEERLSFGSDGEVEALVADFRGDRRLGGVSAAGAAPANLAALMNGPVSASYGSQTSGPHPAAPTTIVASFVAACRSQAAAAAPRAGLPDRPVSPCLVQNGRELSVNSCAHSEPNRSGPRGSKGAASLIPTQRTRKARASGPGSRPQRKVACGQARLTGARLNCGPVPRPAVPTACRTSATLWRSSC